MTAAGTRHVLDVARQAVSTFERPSLLEVFQQRHLLRGCPAGFQEPGAKGSVQLFQRVLGWAFVESEKRSAPSLNSVSVHERCLILLVEYEPQLEAWIG